MSLEGSFRRGVGRLEFCLGSVLVCEVLFVGFKSNRDPCMCWVAQTLREVKTQEC